MAASWMLLALVVSQSPALEPAHARNAVLQEVLDGKYAPDGKEYRIPLPSLRDGQTEAQQKAVLVQMLGSEARLQEVIRDSISAPVVVKVRDDAGDEVIVRQVDIVFAVHADLDAVDPQVGSAELLNRPDRNRVEAGNMSMEAAALDEAALKMRKLAVKPGEHYLHMKGRLLDRIHVETTDHVASTRAADSLIFASRTVPAFDRDKGYPNQWAQIIREDGHERLGQAYVYAGAAGYTKFSRLAGMKDTLLAETHIAFAEPKPWFDGAPILRSKISIVAQEQVRRLRRDLSKARSKK